MLILAPQSIAQANMDLIPTNASSWMIVGVAALALGSAYLTSAWKGLLSTEFAVFGGVGGIGAILLVSGGGEFELLTPSPWLVFILPESLTVLLCGSFIVGNQPVAPGQSAELSESEAENILETAVTQHGSNLLELSRQSPLLVVFLRHFGCTFCREAIAELAAKQAGIQATGSRIVFVHMSGEEEARAFFDDYGMLETDRVSDPEGKIYRTFQLRRGGVRELAGWKVIKRGFDAAVVRGHGLGLPAGDVRQMPGAFLIYRGEVLKSFRHKTAADRPNYTSMADIWPFSLTVAAHGLTAAAAPNEGLDSSEGGFSNN